MSSKAAAIAYFKNEHDLTREATHVNTWSGLQGLTCGHYRLHVSADPGELVVYDHSAGNPGTEVARWTL